MTTTPEFITFTGLDARSDMATVMSLSKKYPIEWGVLFSPKRQGIDPRYPHLDLVDIWTSQYGELRLSAHLCGLYAGRVQGGLPVKANLTGFQRSQVNTVQPDVEKIAAFAEKEKVRAIAQWRTLRFPEEEEIDWLFDKSGGTGESPKSWPLHPGEGRLMGYAGGIGPGNVVEVMNAIKCDDRYWLDMETKIRTNDWLDLEKCRKVCETIYG